METFIYKDLKKACLEKDINKVLTLGPFSLILFKIINESMLKKFKEDINILRNY